MAAGLEAAERSSDGLPEQAFVTPTTDEGTWRLVCELPKQQRAVIAWRFYLDVIVAETAELLNCAPGTVKSHTAPGPRQTQDLDPRCRRSVMTHHTTEDLKNQLQRHGRTLTSAGLASGVRRRAIGIRRRRRRCLPAR